MSRQFILPSSSELERVISCPESIFMPRVIDAGSRYSERGITFHRFAELVGSGAATREEALKQIERSDPGYVLCETFPVEHLPQGGSVELALAYNINTGAARSLGSSLERGYEAAGANRAVEYVGTTDWGGLAGDTALVVDYKSGWPGRVQDSWQLMSLALYLSKLFGAKEARIAYCIPREEDDPIWRYEHLDQFALIGIENRLHQLRDQLLSMQDSENAGDLVEGDYCKYCPGRKRCPAKIAIVQHFAYASPGEPNGADPLTTALREGNGEITPEAVSLLAQKILSYDRARKMIWEQIEDYARFHPIDLGDGRKLMLAPSRMADKLMDEKAALDLIADEFGGDVARAAAGTSKAAIEGAVAEWARAKGAPIGKTKSDAVERLRAEGLIRKVGGKIDLRIVEEKGGGHELPR